MNNHNESYYHCCCGVHVHTFTFVVALLIVLFWSTCTAGVIYSGEYIGLLICVPPLFSYGCLLIGNRASLPGNYCPFLIINLTIIIGAFLFAGVSYLTGAAFISHSFRVGNDSLETVLGSVTVLLGTGVAVCAFFQFYYFYIVYRDYEFVKNQQLVKKQTKAVLRPSRQRRLYVNSKKLSRRSGLRCEHPPQKFAVKINNDSDEDELQHISKQTSTTDIDDQLLFPCSDKGSNLQRSETDLLRPWQERHNWDSNHWPSQQNLSSGVYYDFWRTTSV